MISIIVNFFNNPREARNTLHSLTRAYQRDCGSVEYEVVAIDNGSKHPLREEEVRGFGPEFRYRYVETRSKSPAGAINAAAQDARGEEVMILIDGAHVLSPGILRLAARAFSAFPSPFVSTCSFHLGPQRQNASISQGYDQAREDALLERAGWRTNGYRLFYATRAFADLGEGWFGQMYESGCFAMKRDAFLALGGFDEAFRSPGGGLVNLDFFERAVTSDAVQYVMLLGEGTFHQVHGGVGSNAPLSNHPFPQFAAEYERLRGKRYERPLRRPFFMGQIGNEALAASRASASAGLRRWEERYPPEIDVFGPGG
jgi:glycosyltransferase involved in cell wall biosynthesis